MFRNLFKLFLLNRYLVDPDVRMEEADAVAALVCLGLIVMLVVIYFTFFTSFFSTSSPHLNYQHPFPYLLSHQCPHLEPYKHQLLVIPADGNSLSHYFNPVFGNGFNLGYGHDK